MKMRNIAFVSNYYIVDNEIKYPNNSRFLINFLSKYDRIYLVDPDYQKELPYIRAFSLAENREIILSPNNFELLYTGKAYRPYGSKFEDYNSEHCLSLQLPQFLQLIDAFLPFESTIRFLNPSSAIFFNLSKEYILSLSIETSFPFIKSEKIEKKERLYILKEKGEDIVLKPLISERTLGVKLLREMSNDDISTYFDHYCIESSTPYYLHTTYKQGILAQPYMEDFVRYGERKISVVNGSCTLARNTLSTNNNLVSIEQGANIENYIPTKKEQVLAERVFNYLHEKYHITFLRVDIIGDGKDLYINEIEMINPNFSEDTIPIKETLLEAHFLEMFSIDS